MDTVFNFESGRKQKNAESFTLNFTYTLGVSGLAAHKNGNIYMTSNAQIFMQTKGVGAFNNIGEPSRQYNGICIAPNGDVYTVTYGGDIFKQTNGTGAFVAMGFAVQNWAGCGANYNGDIYFLAYGGFIYKLTGGVGSLVAQTGAGNWIGIVGTPNLDVYVVVNGGGLYKQTGGVGSFVQVGGIPNRDYYNLTYLNNNLYVCVYTSGGVFVRRNMTGDFVAITNPTATSNFQGLCSTWDGALYASQTGTGIHKSPKNAIPVVATSTFGSLGASSNGGGTIAPNGKIYIPSLGNSIVTVIDTLNDSTTTFAVTGGYRGSVLGADGHVYAPPWNPGVLEINPNTNTYTTFATGGASGYWGGALAPNGKIYCAPFSSNFMLEIDTVNKTAITVGVDLGAGSKYAGGGVLAPNGKIYFTPWDSVNILEFDPNTNTVVGFGNIAGGQKFVGGVLAPNGLIYCVPAGTTVIYYFDPNTKVVSSFGSLAAGFEKYEGGVLGKNGKIYFIPAQAQQVLEVDPTTNTTRLVGTANAAAYKWSGGVLAQNGAIYGVPYTSPNILKITGTDNPNLMGADASIPVPIANLPTSNYNKYYNKF